MVEPVEELVKKLHDKNWRVRWEAVQALGKIKDVKIVEPLIDVLGDENFYVRCASAKALEEIGALTVEPLIATLQDNTKNKYARELAAEVLEKLGDTRAIEPLIAALQDKEGDVRAAAAKALEKFGDSRAIEPLIAALQDKEGDVRAAAAKALAKIGDDRAIEPLIAALRDTDSKVRESAMEALKRIDRDWYRSKWAKKQVPDFISALRDKNKEVRETAAELLKEIEPEWSKGEPAKRQLPEFIAALHHKAWEVREGAAQALGAIGDARAVEPLILSLGDEDWEVRKASAKALGEIGDARAVEPLIAALQDKESGVRESAGEALKKIRDNQAALLQSYPNILCAKCLLRTEKKRAKVKVLKTIDYVVCRRCNSSFYLVKGIREVVGTIGGDIGDYAGDINRLYLSLWSEEEKRARNADIDRLEIIPSVRTNYELAITAVWNELHNDTSRPRNYLKKIPVAIRRGVVLSKETIDLLRREFGPVS